MDDSSLHDNLLWRLYLFDGPILVDAAGGITRRFRSQRIGALLAYLALNLGRPCPREELSVALWPDDEKDVTANRLRVCLASLRRQLEPEGITFGAVIDVSEHGRVRLRPETVWCDAAEFDSLWSSGSRVAAARLVNQKALLPGYYDDWVLEARNRYEMLAEDVELPSLMGATGNEEAPEQEPSTVLLSIRREITRRLPLYLTSFFGRDSEIQTLRLMLKSHRLVTLSGPGGIGKTRMAVEAARGIDGGVVFVPLAEVVAEEEAPTAVLRSLNVSAQAGADVMDQLSGVLAQRKVGLIVLDNAEQITSAVADLCLQMLDADPELRVLVTSRQHLEVGGEAVLPLRPLENPPHSSSPEQLSEWPSIALFINRARGIRPDFGFSGRSAEAVVEICQRLEGIPLAIELAAARTASETPIQIVAALNTNLIDLQSRHRGLSARHRSLRAAIQGSFDLLTPELRRFFAALSVFHGGWTAEAATAVTGDSSAREQLLELVTRSLIVAASGESESGVMRFTFLEPLRQFAAEALDAEERLRCLERHTDYYLSLAAQVTQDDVRPYVLVDGEQENVLSALERSSNDRDSNFWRGLFGFVFHAWSRAEHRMTLKWIDEAVAMLPDIVDPAVRQGILDMTTHVWRDVGKVEDTLRLADEILLDTVRNSDPFLRVSASLTKSYVLDHKGDYRQAMDIAVEALAEARRIDDIRLLLWALSMAVTAISDEGQHIGTHTRTGKALLRESEQLCLELIAKMPDFSRHRSTTYYMHSIILDNLGRHEEAYDTLKRAQSLAIDDKKLSTVMYSFLQEAGMVERGDQHEFAAILLGAVFSLQDRMGLDFAELTDSLGSLIERLEKRLGAERYASLLREGKQCSFEELRNRRLAHDQVARI